MNQECTCPSGDGSVNVVYTVSDVRSASRFIGRTGFSGMTGSQMTVVMPRLSGDTGVKISEKKNNHTVA